MNGNKQLDDMESVSALRQRDVLEFDSDTDSSDEEFSLEKMTISGSMEDLQIDALTSDGNSCCNKFFVDYFYEPKLVVGHRHMHELTYLLDFQVEHRQRSASLETKKSCAAQRARLACLVLISFPYLTAALFWDFHYFFVPFTNWTLMVTTLSLLMTMYAATDPINYGESALKRRRALNTPCKYRTVCFMQAFHHLIYTLSIVMNATVMTVYWLILHKA